VVKFILAGLNTQAERLKALEALIEGRPGDVPKHVLAAAKSELKQVKAAVDAARKELEEKAREAARIAKEEADRIRKNPVVVLDPTRPHRTIVRVIKKIF
jgi:hypothetical protein